MPLSHNVISCVNVVSPYNYGSQNSNFKMVSDIHSGHFNESFIYILSKRKCVKLQNSLQVESNLKSANRKDIYFLS